MFDNGLIDALNEIYVFRAAFRGFQPWNRDDEMEQEARQEHSIAELFL